LHDDLGLKKATKLKAKPYAELSSKTVPFLAVAQVVKYGENALMAEPRHPNGPRSRADRDLVAPPKHKVVLLLAPRS
jgi:hypothetical protein